MTPERPPSIEIADRIPPKPGLRPAEWLATCCGRRYVSGVDVARVPMLAAAPPSAFPGLLLVERWRGFATSRIEPPRLHGGNRVCRALPRPAASEGIHAGAAALPPPNVLNSSGGGGAACFL
jgi:hypothetical protein